MQDVEFHGQIFRWSDYGSDSEVTCGGNAVKYRCSLRIAVRELERPRWSESGEDEDVKTMKTLLEVATSYLLQRSLIASIGHTFSWCQGFLLYIIFFGS